MGIGLIVSGRPCTLTLDGWTGEVSGLERIDGQGCDANESTIRTNVFVPGVTTRIGVSVRKAAITVTRNGLPLIKWSGDPARLSPFNEWGMPRTDLLWIASWGEGFYNESIGSFEIESFLIMPIEGTGHWVELGPNRTNDEAEIAMLSGDGLRGPRNHQRNKWSERTATLATSPATAVDCGSHFLEKAIPVTRHGEDWWIRPFEISRPAGQPIYDSGLAHVAKLTNLDFLWLTGSHNRHRARALERSGKTHAIVS